MIKYFLYFHLLRVEGSGARRWPRIEIPPADLSVNFGMLIFDCDTAKSRNLITGRAAGSGPAWRGRGPG